MPRDVQGSGIALDSSSSRINNRFSDPYGSEDLEGTVSVPVKTTIPMMRIPPGFWIPLGALTTAKRHMGLGRAAGGGSYCLMSPVPTSPPVETMMSSRTPHQQLLGDVRSESARAGSPCESPPVVMNRSYCCHTEMGTLGTPHPCSDYLAQLHTSPSTGNPRFWEHWMVGALPTCTTLQPQSTRHASPCQLSALLQLPTGSRWPWMQAATGTGKGQS